MNEIVSIIMSSSYYFGCSLLCPHVSMLRCKYFSLWRLFRMMFFSFCSPTSSRAFFQSSNTVFVNFSYGNIFFVVKTSIFVSAANLGFLSRKVRWSLSCFLSKVFLSYLFFISALTSLSLLPTLLYKRLSFFIMLSVCKDNLICYSRGRFTCPFSCAFLPKNVQPFCNVSCFNLYGLLLGGTDSFFKIYGLLPEGRYAIK